MNSRYIKYEKLIVVVPHDMSHHELAQLLKPLTPISAGHFFMRCIDGYSIAICYGTSRSLRLDSEPLADSIELTKVFNDSSLSILEIEPKIKKVLQANETLLR